MQYFPKPHHAIFRTFSTNFPGLTRTPIKIFKDFPAGEVTLSFYCHIKAKLGPFTDLMLGPNNF